MYAMQTYYHTTKTKMKTRKKIYTNEGTVTLYKAISCDGKLRTTNAREDNIHDLTSPGTRLLTQPPVNVIITDIDGEDLSTESPQTELLWCHYHLGHF